MADFRLDAAQDSADEDVATDPPTASGVGAVAVGEARFVFDTAVTDPNVILAAMDRCIDIYETHQPQNNT